MHPEFTFKKKEGAKNLVTASFKFTEAVKAEDRKGMTKRPNVVNMNLYNAPLVTSKDDSGKDIFYIYYFSLKARRKRSLNVILHENDSWKTIVCYNL